MCSGVSNLAKRLSNCQCNGEYQDTELQLSHRVTAPTVPGDAMAGMDTGLAGSVKALSAPSQTLR